MKKTILSLATAAAVAFTMTGCMGGAPAPQQMVSFEEDFEKFKGKLDGEWIKHPYSNPFIKNDGTSKYYVVRQHRVFITMIITPDNINYGRYVRSEKFFGEIVPAEAPTDYYFNIGFPCDSIAECKAIVQSKEDLDSYFLKVDDDLYYGEYSQKVKEDMNYPSVEYADFMLHSLRKGFEVKHMSSYHPELKDAVGIINIGPALGARIVKAEDYGSTHQKDVENLLAKTEAKRTFRASNLSENFDESHKKAMDQLYLDWAQAKPFYEERKARIVLDEKRKTKLEAYEQKKLEAKRKAKLEADKKAKIEAERKAEEERKQRVEKQKLIEKMKREGV